MLNILLLSSIYPLPEGNKGTPVCHFFTREWVKMGYNVRVIHVQAVYPRFLYWLARLNAKRIAAKTGAIVYSERQNHVEDYLMDDVHVTRVPVFKPIPHGCFRRQSVQKAIGVVLNSCRADEFNPDVIIGHFPNPQIEMLGMLRKHFPLAETGLVLHGDIDIMKRVYGKKLPTLMNDVDIWGFRSKSVQESFEKEFGKAKNAFICYSGIPNDYITDNNRHSFNGPLKSFIYVGLMIDRKYPEKVLDALHEVYVNEDYHLNYVGEGHQLDIIKQRINKYSCQEKVSILGRIPRDLIKEEYDKADCLVMISKGEAYGLVYLEAMARGCITIASRHEGFDGVIIDGENGFLCDAGNSEELAGIIRKINLLTSEEKQRISENAIETAKRLTDANAARLYIDNIISRM